MQQVTNSQNRSLMQWIMCKWCQSLTINKETFDNPLKRPMVNSNNIGSTYAQKFAWRLHKLKKLSFETLPWILMWTL